MINLFKFAAEDKSIDYLNQIFGSMNGIISYPGYTPSGGTITLLSTMFKTFNSVVLAVGALVIVYTTVIGVMSTAHEGEFMGKKFHSLWVPIRTVLGVAALVPTGSGYSSLQLVMMWVIVQGIGAADTIWSTALSYVNVAGSPFAQISLPQTGTKQSLQDLFRGLVCERSAVKNYQNPYIPGSDKGGYFCNANPGNAICKGKSFDPNATSYTLGPNGACGRLSYCNQTTTCQGNKANSLECFSCKAQVVGLSGIVSTLSAIADQFVVADYNYQSYYLKAGVLAQPAGPFGMVPSNEPEPTPPPWLQNYCSDKNLTNCTKAGGLPNPNPGTPNTSNEVAAGIYWTYAIKPGLGNDDFISTVSNYYTDLLEGAVTTYIQEQGQSDSNLSGKLAQAEKPGWLFAGSYYYVIAQINNDNLSQAMPSFKVELTDPATQDNNPMKGFRNNVGASNALINAMTSGETGSSSVAERTGGSTAAAGGAVNDVNSMMLKSSKSGSNPLAQLQQAGQDMLITAQILFAVMISITIVLGLMGNISAFALGTGAINSGGGKMPEE